MTKLYNFKDKIDENELQEIAKCIRNNGVVVFPTETVYGIGANALSFDAVNKIFIAKGRPTDNPLIVHIDDFNMLNKVAIISNDIEKKLINSFWPGPMTIILNKSEEIPLNVTCGLDTVGVRMPSSEIARKIIKEAGVPIAAPSANISGRPSGTNINDIFNELNERVDYIIDGGSSEIGVESTVLKVVNNEVVILRPGKISPEDIENLGIKVKLDRHIFTEASKDENVESPGMKHRHYAPKTQTVLVYSENENKIIDKMKEIIKGYDDNKKICVIGFEENKYLFKDESNVIYLSYGNKDNLLSVSSSIFSTLRKVDELEVDTCLIEGIKKEGLGIAIMNRLIRACEYNIIEI